MKRRDSSRSGTGGGKLREVLGETLAGAERFFFALGEMGGGKGVGDEDTTIVAEYDTFVGGLGLEALGIILDDCVEEFWATLDHMLFQPFFFEDKMGLDRGR